MLCEKPVAYDFRQTRAAAELARSKGLKTKLGFTFRYSPGVQYAIVADRRGLRRARRSSSTATSRTRSGSTRRRRCARSIPTPTSRVIADLARSRATARRSSTSGTGGSARTTAASSARCATSSPSGWCATTGQMMRMNIDDGDIYHGRVHQRRDRLDPDQLRDGRQLSRHRGAHLRREGRDHLPAGRGVRRRRDDQGRHAGRGRVQASWRSRSGSTRPAATRASRGARCSTPT